MRLEQYFSSINSSDDFSTDHRNQKQLVSQTNMARILALLFALAATSAA